MHYTYFPFNNQTILSDYLNSTSLSSQIKNVIGMKSKTEVNRFGNAKELNYCMKGDQKCEPNKASIRLPTLNYEDESDNRSAKTKLFPESSKLFPSHFRDSHVQLLLTHKNVKNKIYPPNSKHSLRLKSL